MGKRIKDAVFNRFIELSDAEFDVLDYVVELEGGELYSPINSLAWKKQLGFSYLVYPSANHTRLSHSLGVKEKAGKIMSSLRKKYPSQITKEDVAYAALAGFGHDAGHGPFSHDSERVYKFQKGKDHEEVTKEIITTQLKEPIEKHGFDPVKVADLATGGGEKSLLTEVLFGEEGRMRLSTDADLLDYVIRDSVQTGVEITAIDLDLLINSFEVRRGSIVFSHGVISDMHRLLMSRNQLAEKVYFHKTSETAQSMWEKSLYLASQSGLDLDSIWRHGDNVALYVLSNFEKEPLARKLSARLYNSRNINKLAVVGKFDKIETIDNISYVANAKTEYIGPETIKKLATLGRDLKKRFELEEIAEEMLKIPEEYEGELTFCIPEAPVEEISSTINIWVPSHNKSYKIVTK